MPPCTQRQSPLAVTRIFACGKVHVGKPLAPPGSRGRAPGRHANLCLWQSSRRETMVGQGRLELPTSRLSGVYSNQLSYWPLSDAKGKIMGSMLRVKLSAEIYGYSNLCQPDRLQTTARHPYLALQTPLTVQLLYLNSDPCGPVRALSY